MGHILGKSRAGFLGFYHLDSARNGSAGKARGDGVNFVAGRTKLDPWLQFLNIC